MRQKMRIALVSFTLLLGICLPITSVNAASIYDNVYRTVDRIAVSGIGYGVNCPSQDISHTWEKYLLDSRHWYADDQQTRDMAASLQTAFDNGSWAVSYADTTTESFDREQVIVMWSESTGTVTFDDVSASLNSTSKMYQVIIGPRRWSITNGDCTPIGFDFQSINGGRYQISLAATSSTMKNYFVANANVTYPTGYEGAAIATSPPNATYVAMGDSFSSGEGNPPFEAKTDTSSNTCHRSPQAWPRLLEFDSSLDLGATAFVACSGAVSDYIINEYNQENVELPQAAYITNDTELVTITIGGNDVGFGDVLRTCTLARDDDVSTEEEHQLEHDGCINAIEDAQDIATSTTFQNKLETVFSGIRSLGSSNLQLIVVGYPNLFPEYGDIVGTCRWEGDWFTNTFNQTSGRDVAEDEVTESRVLHDNINSAIEAAVEATNDSNVHFVDPSSVFVGHELCRPYPWFNGVIPAIDDAGRAESYHPNSDGQLAYESVVESEIENLFP